MRRLRTARFRSLVMPLLLAALVFRVLIPPGFMMAGAGSSSLVAAMCATTTGKTEKIELPGGSQAHCENCVPPPGAPLAVLVIEPPLRATTSAFIAEIAQVEGFTLIRAQSARAPPSV